MKNHKLKTWPKEFSAMLFGSKSFEVRVNDRDFMVGDYLQLEEWDPETEQYTGRVLMRHVTYIMKGAFGIPSNMIIMSVVMV